jgi:hypothetical protein
MPDNAVLIRIRGNNTIKATWNDTARIQCRNQCAFRFLPHTSGSGLYVSGGLIWIGATGTNPVEKDGPSC